MDGPRFSCNKTRLNHPSYHPSAANACSNNLASSSPGPQISDNTQPTAEGAKRRAESERDEQEAPLAPGWGRRRSCGELWPLNPCRSLVRCRAGTGPHMRTRTRPGDSRPSRCSLRPRRHNRRWKCGRLDAHLQALDLPCLLTRRVASDFRRLLLLQDGSAMSRVQQDEPSTATESTVGPGGPVRIAIRI